MVWLRISSSANMRKNWLGLFIMGTLSVSLAVGWWLDRTGQLSGRPTAGVDDPSADLANVLPERTKRLVSFPSAGNSASSYEKLRSENDDLILFIDEAYTLLHENGIHLQLDIEKAPDGRLRLKTDSLNLLDQLEAKLHTINEQPTEAEPEK